MDSLHTDLDWRGCAVCVGGEDQDRIDVYHPGTDAVQHLASGNAPKGEALLSKRTQVVGGRRLRVQPTANEMAGIFPFQLMACSGFLIVGFFWRQVLRTGH